MENISTLISKIASSIAKKKCTALETGSGFLFWIQLWSHQCYPFKRGNVIDDRPAI